MTQRPRLSFRYTRTSELSRAELDELWSLFDKHFEEARPAFETSVREADEVLRYRSGAALEGMGLVKAYRSEHEGRSFRVLWTGAVVLEPEWRGHNAIQAAGLWRLLRERARHPLESVYWHFNAGTAKSYLLLPRNFVEYWPRPDVTDGGWLAGALRALCIEQYGDHYDARTGLINPGGRRPRPGVSESSPDNPDPHVRYFERMNPNAAAGEGIACLCPLNVANIASLGSRLVRRLWRRRR